jgi:hypothetical protein
MIAPNPSSPRRKRGAQPGNVNALKHGFYSHYFTRSEKERLSSELPGELSDEEKLLNIVIDRALMSMKREKLGHDGLVVALRAISLSLVRKARIQRFSFAADKELDRLKKATQKLEILPPEEG